MIFRKRQGLLGYFLFAISLSCLATEPEKARLDLRGMSRIELESGTLIVKGNIQFPGSSLPRYWEIIDAEDAISSRVNILGEASYYFNQGTEAAIGFYLNQLDIIIQKYQEVADRWDAIGLDGNAEDARRLIEQYEKERYAAHAALESE